VGRTFRIEILVTAIATPSNRMISPTICAPNSELPSESGIVEESAAGSPAPLAAGLPGAGLGAAEGLICGNRLDALPAGIVVVVPGTAAPTTGIVPRGRL
jgi:hypothetical protein